MSESKDFPFGEQSLGESRMASRKKCSLWCERDGLEKKVQSLGASKMASRNKYKVFGESKMASRKKYSLWREQDGLEKKKEKKKEL